jgi:hypothetical protein
VLHSLIHCQLDCLQTIFLAPAVRAPEEGAVAEEEHGVGLGESSSGKPRVIKRLWTSNMLQNLQHQRNVRIWHKYEIWLNPPNVLQREPLRHIACDVDEVELECELLRTVSIHGNEMEGTQLPDVIDLGPYARTRRRRTVT